jgi:hypothetical protein
MPAAWDLAWPLRSQAWGFTADLAPMPHGPRDNEFTSLSLQTHTQRRNPLVVVMVVEVMIRGLYTWRGGYLVF